MAGSLSKNVADHFLAIKINFPMRKMHPVAFGGPAFCLPVLFCGYSLSPSVLQKQYSCPKFDFLTHSVKYRSPERRARNYSANTKIVSTKMKKENHLDKIFRLNCFHR